jgi:hypothetical protein
VSEEVSLNLEQEVVVGLVGKHERGLAVLVGLPLLTVLFDATKANFGRCSDDLLQVCAGGFGI